VLTDFRHYSFAEQVRIPGIIKRENPDLVHFPHFNVPVLYHGNYIVTVHDMLMHKSVGLEATTLPAPLYLLKRFGYRFVFDNAVRHARKIIVPSLAVKNELIGFYKIPENKVNVTYEGIDPKIIGDMETLMQKPYFVYTGNAYPHKNLSRLIEAVKILNTKSSQSVNLAIVSSRGIFTQRVENLIQKLAVKEYVKVLGFVPDEKLGSLYKNSAGFVFPSLSEGFGLPGLEAMSSGTLLLASDIPVFKEIYQDNAIYFDPESIDSIEKALESVFKMSEGTRNEKIKKGKDFVKRHSWVKMARETLDLYESCNSIRSGK
jgi:glycosyltransferase involved in cell wall biosynthesis